jgi:stalled ribosome rescue protein Dom34
MKMPAMSHAHVCVWIDHREAKVFGIGLEGADEERVVEPGPHHHIHRKADHVGKGKAPPDHGFFDAVAETLASARAILIAGPGQARDELAAYLNLHHPAVARRVWGVEAMDHPTDREIVATARQFFRNADRMHA